MEFRVLGAFEVWDGEQPVEIAGSKRRALLAFLVLRANEFVRSELLIDELWAEHPPRNAAAALQTHVSRLRKTLGAGTIASREWGYVLRTAPSDIDLGRFKELVYAAHPLAAKERANKLAEALALWRGRPLADLVDEPVLQRDIAHLEETRLITLEERIACDLEAGRSAGLIGELGGLVAEHPLRESLRWLLILALYRAGRQAEALEVYRETRRFLAEELGLEPSPALRELEQAILRQDPSLIYTHGEGMSGTQLIGRQKIRSNIGHSIIRPAPLMTVVRLKCPETGKSVDLGEVPASILLPEDLVEIPPDRQIPCPHCGQSHTWTTAQAALALQALRDAPNATVVVVDADSAVALR